VAAAEASTAVGQSHVDAYSGMMGCSLDCEGHAYALMHSGGSMQWLLARM
jgi:hypothetical protein